MKIDKTKVYEIHEAIRAVVGEEQATNISVHVQKQRVKLPPNMMVMQAFAYLASTKMKPNTNRLLMYLFSQSAYENYLSIDIKKMAEDLGCGDKTIINSLNELCKNNIVLRIPHPADKRRNDYFINPLAAWKGNSYERNKTIKKLQTAREKEQISLFNE